VLCQQLRHREVGSRGRTRRLGNGRDKGCIHWSHGDDRLRNLYDGRVHRHLIRMRTVARSGADGGTSGGKYHSERDHEHAIGTQKNISGFFGHWQSTLSDLVSHLRLIVNSEWSPAPLEVARLLTAKRRIVK
jgi:hypothetical protein